LRAKATWFAQSRWCNSCTTIILYGWKCKSRCNIRLTLRSEMPNAMACFAAERRGLVTTARLTVSTFSGVRTVRAPPGGFFFSPEPVALKFAIHSKIVFLLGTLQWQPTLKRTQKRLCVRVTESLVLKNVSTTKAQCSMSTEIAYFELLKVSEHSLPTSTSHKLVPT
jgi:hypothetical protein